MEIKLPGQYLDSTNTQVYNIPTQLSQLCIENTLKIHKKCELWAKFSEYQNLTSVIVFYVKIYIKAENTM